FWPSIHPWLCRVRWNGSHHCLAWSPVRLMSKVRIPTREIFACPQSSVLHPSTVSNAIDRSGAAAVLRFISPPVLLSLDQHHECSTLKDPPLLAAFQAELCAQHLIMWGGVHLLSDHLVRSE